jgi:hypothetical protein
MNSTITSYYISELDKWKDAINLHFEEMNDADEWLNEVLHYNTVPKLAAKVEHHLNQIMLCRQLFDDLNDDILLIENKVSKDNVPLPAEEIVTGIMNQQNVLRENIYKAEKQLLEVKYECNQFLADTMNVQK